MRRLSTHPTSRSRARHRGRYERRSHWQARFVLCSAMSNVTVLERIGEGVELLRHRLAGAARQGLADGLVDRLGLRLRGEAGLLDGGPMH